MMKASFVKTIFLFFLLFSLLLIEESLCQARGGGRGRGRGRNNGRGGRGGEGTDTEDRGGGGGRRGNCRKGNCPLKANTVEKIKADMRKFIVGLATAHALRIGFHDCVGDLNNPRPKCDGCLNRNNRQNKGALLATLAKMDRLYEKKYRKRLSRADFYAIGSIVAVEQAVEYNNDKCDNDDCKMPPPEITFRYGRVDCPTTPNEPETIGFPSGLLNFTGTIGFFKREFDMDERESTAIMGAHTLGGAAESGFLGFWKGSAEEAKKFNNDFYKVLINEPGDIEYINVDKRFVTGAPRTRWQWDGFKVSPNGRRSPAAFMLNADMCLFKDIKTDKLGESSCSYDTCPRARTANVVEEYARDKQTFMDDYDRAHEKFINKGYRRGELKLPKGSCPRRIGPDRTFYDESCLNPGRDAFGGRDCNAGGVDQACRFCGGRKFAKQCP